MASLSPDNPRLKALLLQLPLDLQQHIEWVRGKALELAGLHHVDPLRTEVAAMAHDLARGMRPADLFSKAREWRLAFHPVEQQVTVLLHAPVGAEMLRLDCGVEDPEVLEAVRWHTTFNRGLGPVAKIVFLADKLDPHKLGRYPFLKSVDALAREDLNASVRAFLQGDLASMIGAGRLVHPASVEGLNELIANPSP